MEKFQNLVSLICLFLGIGTLNATQWSVSNHPANPGQFNSIQSAINSSNVMPGDTLLIHPTGNRYGLYETIEITKRLTLIGGGFNTQNGSSQRVAIHRIAILSETAAAAASGSKFYGLIINYFQVGNFNASLSDITFENCYFDCTPGCPNESGIQFYNGPYPINLTVKNCAFYSCTYDAPINFGQLNSGNYPGSVTILNSVFSNCGEQSIESYKGTMLVSNCTFLTPSPIEDVKYATFQNCIFNEGSFMPNVIDNVFNNCIAKDCSLPPAGNTGVDNISNTAVIFIPNTLQLDPSSPGYTGGNDGQQMGIYGGSSTYSSSGEPHITPITRNFIIKNSTIPQNGNLTIDLLVTKPLKSN